MKRAFACFSLIAALILVPAISTPSYAQEQQLSLSPPTSNYQVGMTFYKVIKRQPNFEDWIKADTRYIQASPEMRDKILRDEVQKMETEFNAFDPKKNPIVIRTAVQVNIKPGKEAGKKTLEVQFMGAGPIYFPYLVADQNISIIPNGIDLYRSIPLSEQEANKMQSRIDYSGMVTMVIEIVPTAAEGRRPTTLDGVPQWLMIGEIGFLGFFNNYLQEVWSSQAPGYIRKDQHDIFGLHGTQTNGINSLKP